MDIWNHLVRERKDNLGIGFALLSPNGDVITAPYPLDTDRGGVQNEPVICALRKAVTLSPGRWIPRPPVPKDKAFLSGSD